MVIYFINKRIDALLLMPPAEKEPNAFSTSLPLSRTHLIFPFAGSRRGIYSIEKARRLLHFEPRVGIEEGMKITEQWLRAEHWIEPHG